jgi:hypothetical protein
MTKVQKAVGLINVRRVGAHYDISGSFKERDGREGASGLDHLKITRAYG